MQNLFFAYHHLDLPLPGFVQLLFADMDVSGDSHPTMTSTCFFIPPKKRTTCPVVKLTPFTANRGKIKKFLSKLKMTTLYWWTRSTAHHLGQMKSYKSWDKPPANWCRSYPRYGVCVCVLFLGLVYTGPFHFHVYKRVPESSSKRNPISSPNSSPFAS